MLDGIALLFIAAFFGYAAFHGSVKQAGSETLSLALDAAPFLAGALVIWMLWQIPGWQEPVAIFTIIIVIALATNSYSKIDDEVKNIIQFVKGSAA